MALVETIVRRDQWDVDLRLSQLGLSRAKLLSVVSVAMNERANATPFHPANAAGTFAYQHGTWSLRHEFVGGMWVEDRANGVEAIRNDTLKIRVAFSNVDLACNDDHLPKPRSHKGAGAERASGGGLFEDLPRYAEVTSGDWSLYYLMVDEAGAAELTRPIVKGGTFSAAVERIYLSEGDDDIGSTLLDDNDDVANGFDPQVVRR